MTKDQVLAALPALSANDLQAIQAATAVLLAGSTPSSPKAAKTPLAWLYEALQGVAGWPPMLTFDRFMASTAGGHYKRTAPAAMAFMVQAFGSKAMGNKITALAIMRSMVELLVADLRNRDAPITAGVIASNLGRLNEIFEAAYPNYLHSGIAAMVLNAIKRKRK